jgi:hypothetical protein
MGRAGQRRRLGSGRVPDRRLQQCPRTRTPGVRTTPAYLTTHTDNPAETDTHNPPETDTHNPPETDTHNPAETDTLNLGDRKY